MGKVCVSHDTLLITDNDSATQDDKSPPPCMQLQAGVGLFLRTQTHPPPHLQLQDGVGFFHSFFRSTNNDDDEPCVDICVRLHPQQQRQKPTPLHAMQARVGF